MPRVEEKLVIRTSSRTEENYFCFFPNSCGKINNIVCIYNLVYNKLNCQNWTNANYLMFEVI